MLAPLRERHAQAGLAAVAVLDSVAITAVSFLIVPAVAIVLIVGLVALLLPFAVGNWCAHSRRRAARVLWPDIVDHLVSAVQSGLALPDSVVTRARTGPNPTHETLAGFELDYRATGNFSISIDGLKARLADPAAEF